MPLHYGNSTPPKIPRELPTAEHRCSQCYVPGFGKSAIRCKNEPPLSTRERAEAFLATRRQINEDEKGKS